MEANSKPPKVFISYAWEDDIKPWVRAFAKRLRKDGIETVLDQWETEYGDQLPEFMERAVRASDFVILICTPKYKKKSDEREGGVGYEGHIITAEIFEKSNHRKFIPVLRKGLWALAAPSWAAGKLYIDLRANPYSEENYRDLLRTLHGRKPTPPPIGLPPEFPDEDEEPPKTNSLVNFFSRLKETFTASSDKFRLYLPKVKPFFRIAGLTGAAVGLLWASSWAVPQVLALFPTPITSITPLPTGTITLSSSPVPFTKTIQPSATPTRTETSDPIATITKTSTPESTPTVILDIGSSLISEKDGMKLLYVPASEFTMGSNNGNSDERPPHQVFLYPFWIDETEVTDEMYGLCVKTGSCDELVDNSYTSLHPVNQVTWYDAVAYCTWAGRRLPTEAEWEKAARGTDQRIYPWGNQQPTSNLVNMKYPSHYNSTLVGSFPEAASPYGALDMAGNVWEWVNDWYDDTYYSHAPPSNPTGPSTGNSKIIRGGSYFFDWDFENGSKSIRTTERAREDPLTRYIKLGFRCAMDANP
jgi:formylglycine-generating enzyme required for sulfatase activity